MKVNAPEKIYLQKNTTTDCYGEFWPEWFEARAKDSDIEYTRTDAFIEKAYEFFSEYLYEYIDVKNANCDTFINIDGDKLKEDFRKYMEGE